MPSLEWNRRWGHEFSVFWRSRPSRLYGVQWGDPRARGIAYWLQRVRHPLQIPGPLYRVVDRYITPYVSPQTDVLEIGSGGGRWTQFLVKARRIVVVDINPEFFPALKELFPSADLEFYQPRGCELAGVENESIDFVFSFGTFVHIDPGGIREYLAEVKRILRPNGTAIIHYAEKRKLVARLYRGFSHMTAIEMERMAPMSIVEHETHMLTHSNIIVLRK